MFSPVPAPSSTTRWAFGYNLAALSLAAVGLLNPAIARKQLPAHATASALMSPGPEATV